MRSNGQQVKAARKLYQGMNTSWGADWSHDRSKKDCAKPMREYRPNYNSPPRS